MFGKSKKKKEVSGLVNGNSLLSTQNVQSSNSSSHRTEIRTFSETRTSVGTTTTTTKNEFLQSSTAASINKNSTIAVCERVKFTRPNLPSQWRNSTAEVDAKPFMPSSTYQSPYYGMYGNSGATTVKNSESTRSLPTQNNSITQGNYLIPKYETNGKKRGKVLVINNVKFLNDKNHERFGAEKDEKDLKTMFKSLGFEVETYKNLKCKEIKTKINTFKKDRSLRNYDISVVVMMSHGSNRDKDGNVVAGGYTEICGVDNVGMSIEELLNEFSGQQCPQLLGKPKIFIIQCCRGDGAEKNARDAVSYPTQNRSYSDMLVAYSTLPGFVSNRHPENGSWYIQSICDVFKAHAKDCHVEDMLKVVNEELSKKHPYYNQTSMYECRGFKRCFLNPV